MFTFLFSSPNIRAVFALLAVIVLAVLGLIGWCVWRFCRKKRPKKDDKDAAPVEDDEQGILENEEIKDDEADEAKKAEEAKGKIKYKLEYDFTTQELKVTVSHDDDDDNVLDYSELYLYLVSGFLYRFSGYRVSRSSPHGLVHRPDGSLRQGLLAAGQEAQIRDKGAQEEPQPQVRPDVHLQKHSLRVSLYMRMAIF